MGFGLGDLGKIGGIVKDVGSAAGGLTSSFQAITGPKGVNRNELLHRVQDARQAGVHPLFALGAPVGGTQSIHGGAGAAIQDAFEGVGGAMQGPSKRAAARAELRMAERESASRIKVNETQSMLNNARSRTLLSEMQNNPGLMNTVETRRLDPSHLNHPDTGRLAMWRDASGKWHRVDQKKAPSHVLEQEFGESSELQGITRLLEGMYGYKGYGGNSPSLREIYDLFTK